MRPILINFSRPQICGNSSGSGGGTRRRQRDEAQLAVFGVLCVLYMLQRCLGGVSAVLLSLLLLLLFRAQKRHCRPTPAQNAGTPVIYQPCHHPSGLVSTNVMRKNRTDVCILFCVFFFVCVRHPNTANFNLNNAISPNLGPDDRRLNE